MSKRNIRVGNLIIGKNGQMIPQVMLKCKTSDVNLAIEQIKMVKSYGIELVRVSILDEEDAKAIKTIKDNIDINLIGDIHFDYQLALLAIDNGIDKIRLNPSNITNKEHQALVILKAKEKHIPIRIGINGGSLYQGQKLNPYTIIDLIEKEVYLLESYGFEDIILSAKVNNINEAVIINRVLHKNYVYPIHIGITEAGSLIDATIKSSIFLSQMKKLKIGSTVRVSVNGSMESEVIVLKRILINLGYMKGTKLIICPTCGRMQFNMSAYVKAIESICYHSSKPITVALMGCVVNGPGEAKEANIAIVGGVKKVLFYINGVLDSTVEEKELVSTFIYYFNRF